jgi:hypothetical protein
MFTGASTPHALCTSATLFDSVMADTAPMRQHVANTETAANMRSLATQEQLALGTPGASTTAPRAQPVMATLVAVQPRATDMARVAVQLGEDARTLLTHSVPLDSADGMRPLLLERSTVSA